MPLELQPCTEPDLVDFTRIMNSAFSSLGHGMMQLLIPNPMPDDHLEKSIEKHVKSFREEEDVTYLKIIDTDLNGKMIAGAKWRINKTERTEEQIQKMLPVPGKDEEGRPAAQDFMWFLHRVRKEYMGTKPFYFLHILVTDPEHHRRGAGTMLLKWGLEQADKDNMPAFLESSSMARPLYTSLGFSARHEEIWDLKKYGLEGTDTSTVMIRDPVSRGK
ncbi:hypothetical protein IAQ61_001638 [Plenodomus lingam]|uniref:N-acetyltransferase domain-containing protein n=1 Tax=Leptosphaeria maculans (strain JN3 / isolate v23.1.3 / race Av1-4-5-6-7-8) TaxID=985895 RepID=M1Z7M1_LEPMJ|nr:hypothetical protein IAQ61_001638 [Plenodomus lingam]CCT61081.1 hypothetical protein [Plenodomus lingam JN3]